MKRNLKQLFSQSIESLAEINPVQTVIWPELNQRQVSFSIKRDDLLHPLASGNKLYKLWGHIQQIKERKIDTILSFGGGYSNHLHALAAAGEALQIATIGIIRGHRPKQLSPTLLDCQRMGMELHFVSRKQYSEKELSEHVRHLVAERGSVYTVPEGGGGAEGALYCQSLMTEIEARVPKQSTICVPCGTGTTFKGMLMASTPDVRLMGFSALKTGPKDLLGGVPQLSDDIQRTLASIDGGSIKHWRVDYNSHRRGFAKSDDELVEFLKDFYLQTKIPLEPVYTGKMMIRIRDLAREGYWQAGDHVVAVHTGGLQGLRGYPQLKAIEPSLTLTDES